MPPVPVEPTDDVAEMVRFATHVRGLPNAERKAVAREWEDLLGRSGASGNVPLHLALLLANPGRNSLAELARARTLLTAYLAGGADKPEGLLDFARYQLRLLDEGERWLKTVAKERQARAELEQKLEALKAIERRMTNQDRTDKVPLR